MLQFVTTRFLQALLTLLVASFVVFVIARATGNPADTLQSPETPRAEREAFIKRMGFDKPIMVQYWIYIKDVVRGDFGTSLRTKRPVTELVDARVWNSVRLATAAMVFALLVGIPLGVVAAVYRHSIWSRLAMTFALLGQALPGFWVGLVAILVFTLWLGWLPGTGMGGWQHYIMPAVTLGWFISAAVVRLLRSSLLEVLDSEYIKLARTKGVAEYRVVWKHALRNALISVVTFFGLMYGLIIAGAITTEVVFNWPGLGRLAYEAVLWRDFPLLQFVVLVFVLFVIVINFIVDVAYVVLDPRIRL